MKIDIYSYPEGADARTLLEYRTAVQQAFLNGASIELRRCGQQGAYYGLVGAGPTAAGTPLFDWSFYEYRVARPKIAAGHNPEGFTDEQVGEGYRLLTAEELKGPRREGVQYWHREYRRWEDGFYKSSPHCAANTYRTKLPHGEYLWKDRFFRNSKGLFDGSYCIRVKQTCSDYVHLDGRINQPAKGEGWTLDECLRMVADGFWVEFDGNLDPWRRSVAIAVGHNPWNLTEEQVETHAGWRLLSREEVEYRHNQYCETFFSNDARPKTTTNIQCWLKAEKMWNAGPVRGASPSHVYRTKLPHGHFLPPPQRTVEEWLKQLPAGYRERALKNTPEANRSKRCDNMRVAVDVAFYWPDSPEGFNFWSDVQNHYRDPHNPLPALPVEKDTRHWTERLPAAYLERLEKRYAEQPIPGLKLCETASLSSAIVWSETREGHDFWSDVNYYLEGRRATLPPLPPLLRTLKPWTLQTVPLPCVFLRGNEGDPKAMRFLPVFVTERGVAMGSRLHGNPEHSIHSWDDLLKGFMHSVDGGKTWKPCGVEEIA